ncbi:hypothetical protein THTE_4116 [Thermogutta terrifontis]|uniref:Uncharacterized protein n=1 Tax=Thermogutta terrifontis TaxID=1331910 RepID=A0A286RLC0_9BACT|nr:hypothetical protein THTE_4116 [Thermogutta terrifontis]
MIRLATFVTLWSPIVTELSTIITQLLLKLLGLVNCIA